MDFMDGNWYQYLILPLFIFCARIIDVSIGTLRIIFLSRGYKNIAPIMGFFEVLIWIFAISSIMRNLDNFLTYIAYASGFATGTYVGMRIEERLALGNLLIRIFSSRDSSELLKALHISNFKTTSLDAHGQYENVQVIFSVVKRERLKEIADLIETHYPKAFYTVEDIRHVSEGVYSNISGPVNRIWKFAKRK